MSVETTKQAEKLIQDWLNDRGILVPSSNSVPDEFYFVANGKTANDIPFTILQPKSLKNAVVVLANVVLGKEHFDAFIEMKADDREKFLWDLQRDIMFAPPSYSFNPEYKEKGVFKGLQFIREISYDELTQGKLSDAMNDVSKCVLWVISTFARAFGPLVE